MNSITIDNVDCLYRQLPNIQNLEVLQYVVSKFNLDLHRNEEELFYILAGDFRNENKEILSYLINTGVNLDIVIKRCLNNFFLNDGDKTVNYTSLTCFKYLKSIGIKVDLSSIMITQIGINTEDLEFYIDAGALLSPNIIFYASKFLPFEKFKTLMERYHIAGTSTQDSSEKSNEIPPQEEYTMDKVLRTLGLK